MGLGHFASAPCGRLDCDSSCGFPALLEKHLLQQTVEFAVVIRVVEVLKSDMAQSGTRPLPEVDSETRSRHELATMGYVRHAGLYRSGIQPSGSTEVNFEK